MEKRKKECEASSSGFGIKRPKLSDSNEDANRGSTQQTIPEMFFSQRPIQIVACPACATRLSISMINNHLDKQCLVIKECQEDDEEDVTTDAPGGDAVKTSGYASTSHFGKDKPKKRCNSKGEHERKNQQEYQSNKNMSVPVEHSSEDIELQSTNISTSYPDKQKSSTEETSTSSRYFDVKVTSPYSNITHSSTPIPKSKNNSAYTERSNLETNKVASTANLSGDITSQSPSQIFSRISPAKPAKVKIYANPLSTPPRSQKPTDNVDYAADRGLNLSAHSNVSKQLFPDQHIPSTSHQISADASKHHDSLQLVSNSQETAPFSNDNKTSFSRRINNPKSQYGITVKEESSQSDIHFIPKLTHVNISPAKPAKVKIYSSPLSSPPRSQSMGNTNCKSMSQNGDHMSSQSGVLSTTSQDSLVSSLESGSTDLPESPGTPDSLYWTPEASPHGPQEEVSSQSQLIDESHPESQETPLFQFVSDTNHLQSSQSSGSSTIFLTAESTNDTQPEIGPPGGEDLTSPTMRDTPRQSVNSPYKHEGVPYYLANFKLILDTVLDNRDDRSLFNDTDLMVVEAFRNLSEPSQKLYVRLYRRKHAWLRISKIEYTHIASDLVPVSSELIEAGLFMNENDLKEPEEILNLLQAPELRDLAKSFKVNVSQNQQNLVQTLLIHGRKQKSVLGGGLMTKICQRAKKTLAECIKLKPETKAVFSRMMLLFSITSDHEEEDRSSNKQTPMQTMLMVDMGRMKFAKYKVERPHKIFHSRDALIRYEMAHKYEADIIAAMATNHYDSSFILFEKACDEQKSINNTFISQSESLPTFLQRYTALWVYTRITYLGVEILQKKGCYDDAVKLLKRLLNQNVYCQDNRGRWWDRLSLNLSYHLKKPKEALNAIKQGLVDKKVKPAYCLALQQRAEKICGSSARNPLRNELNSLPLTQYQDAPKNIIMGRILPHAQKGRNNIFVRSVTDAKGDVIDVVCSVEEVALEHYRECGYNEGIHAEGSSICTLIFILFWDIVFAEGVPDVFRNQFQAAPLDLRTQDFYLNRRQAIDARLEQIKQADPATLGGMLQKTWDAVCGEFCIGVNWQTFRDLEHAKSLLVCFGGDFLSTVAERMLKDHRHFRAGIPDLTVWNTNNNTFKLVEVKGPGDHLSHKQIIWLDFFLKHGIQAEVCHVKAYTQKKQRMKAMTMNNDEI